MPKLYFDKNLLKQIPEYVRDTLGPPWPLWTQLQAFCPYDEPDSPCPSDDWAKAEALAIVAADVARMLVCAFFGHDEQDATTARQMEDGGFAMYCSRCPWGAKGHW